MGTMRCGMHPAFAALEGGGGGGRGGRRRHFVEAACDGRSSHKLTFRNRKAVLGGGKDPTTRGLFFVFHWDG
jgi:hypothetical protein